MRSLLAAFVALRVLTATHGTPTLSIHVQRTSLDLLDSLAIGVVLDNRSSRPVTLRFPGPREYTIDIVRGRKLIWSSLLKPSANDAVHYPVHQRTILPGAQTLATYDWNALASDGTSPPPGTYTIRVRLNDVGAQPIATTRIRFVDPTPISALDDLKLGDEITLSGRLDSTHQVLTDGTGSTTLPRRILNVPNGPVVVRGYIAVLRNGRRYLAITRWAPER